MSKSVRRNQPRNPREVSRSQSRSVVSAPELLEFCWEPDCECYGVTEYYRNGLILHRGFTDYELALGK